MSVEAVAEWPCYQSHKRVYALKVASVDGHRITPAEEGFAPIDCDPKMFARGAPAPGSYLVEYEGDGYRSFSPGQAFEEGYRPVSGLTFGDALALLKAGRRVARAGWNGKGMWLCRVTEWNGNFGGAIPEDSAWPFAPFICMKPAVGPMVPWLASQFDILAEDWCEISWTNDVQKQPISKGSRLHP